MELTEIYNSDNHDSLQNQAPIKPKTNIYKPLFFTFFAFFLITISCLITIFLTKNKTIISSPITTNEITKPTSEIVSTPSPSTIIDETQNWQTYTDSVHKYLFKYPTDWVLTQPKDGYVTYIRLASPKRNNLIKQQTQSEANPEIYINSYNSFSELPEYSVESSNFSFSFKNAKTLEEYIKGQLNNVKKININGVTGFSGYNTYSNHEIYLQKGNIIINIITEDTEDSEYENSIAQQIINTIKFN